MGTRQLLQHRLVRYGLLGLGAVLLIAAGAFGYRFMSSTAVSSLPANIRQNLAFSPLVIPKTADEYKASSYKYSTAEDGTDILSYYITTNNDGTVAITQSVQPPAFEEIPDYKSQFLTNTMKQYATVQTSSGTIYLGRAAKQNNRQIAIMLERGLIIFLNPLNASDELDEKAWRGIGEALEIEKTQT